MMNKNFSKMDKELIKLRYGSMKGYKKAKITQRKRDEEKILLDCRIKERLIMQNYFENIRVEKENQRVRKDKMDIKEATCKIYSNEYKKWLIVYDLLNSSYYEIKSSLLKNKISREDVIEVVKTCNNIHNIFNIEDVLQFISI